MQLESRTTVPQSLISGETLETAPPWEQPSLGRAHQQPTRMPGRFISLSAARGMCPGSTVCPIRGAALGLR